MCDERKVQRNSRAETTTTEEEDNDDDTIVFLGAIQFL